MDGETVFAPAGKIRLYHICIEGTWVNRTNLCLKMKNKSKKIPTLIPHFCTLSRNNIVLLYTRCRMCIGEVFRTTQAGIHVLQSRKQRTTHKKTKIKMDATFVVGSLPPCAPDRSSRPWHSLSKRCRLGTCYRQTSGPARWEYRAGPLYHRTHLIHTPRRPIYVYCSCW